MPTQTVRSTAHIQNHKGGYSEEMLSAYKLLPKTIPLYLHAHQDLNTAINFSQTPLAFHLNDPLITTNELIEESIPFFADVIHAADNNSMDNATLKTPSLWYIWEATWKSDKTQEHNSSQSGSNRRKLSSEHIYKPKRQHGSNESSRRPSIDSTRRPSTPDHRRIAQGEKSSKSDMRTTMSNMAGAPPPIPRRGSDSTLSFNKRHSLVRPLSELEFPALTAMTLSSDSHLVITLARPMIGSRRPSVPVIEEKTEKMERFQEYSLDQLERKLATYRKLEAAQIEACRMKWNKLRSRLLTMAASAV